MNVMGYDPDWPTNYPDWYHDIGAAHHNVALWATFHERYHKLDDLKTLPWWHQVDKIFVLGQESDNSDWVYEDPRIWVWDSRYLPDRDRFHSFFWWWWQTVQVERYQNATAKLQHPITHRPQWHFECLLGQNRTHRRFVNDAIKNSDIMRDRCLSAAAWMPGTEIEQLYWPNGRIVDDYQLPYGHGAARANIITFIPYLIYNQCWFSVLAETRTDYNFFTEKTAKLLLARRMFVAVGAANLLQELRDMGFETFGSVLDESYDSVTDDARRWRMAVEQITEICRQDPAVIYQKIWPVLEHNRQHLLQEDLISRAQKQMIAILSDK